MVRNNSHHFIYHNCEKSKENMVIKTDIPNVPTTSMERGIKACWTVLSMKSRLNVIIALFKDFDIFACFFLQAFISLTKER